jgi:hypothetical protein
MLATLKIGIKHDILSFIPSGLLEVPRLEHDKGIYVIKPSVELMAKKAPWEVAEDIYQDREVSALGLCKFIPPPQYSGRLEKGEFYDWLETLPDSPKGSEIGVYKKKYQLTNVPKIHSYGILLVNVVEQSDVKTSVATFFNLEGKFYICEGGDEGKETDPNVAIAEKTVSSTLSSFFMLD